MYFRNVFFSRPANILLREVVKFDSTILFLAMIVNDWKGFKDDFNLRHKIIHGRDTCSRKMALIPVETMLKAVNDLYQFANSRNINLHDRLPIRKKIK